MGSDRPLAARAVRLERGDHLALGRSRQAASHPPGRLRRRPSRDPARGAAARRDPLRGAGSPVGPRQRHVVVGPHPLVPQITHVSSPRRRRSLREVRVHIPERVERVMHNGLPVTPVARTLLDFASVARLERVRRPSPRPTSAGCSTSMRSTKSPASAGRAPPTCGEPWPSPPRARAHEKRPRGPPPRPLSPPSPPVSGGEHEGRHLHRRRPMAHRARHR